MKCGGVFIVFAILSCPCAFPQGAAPLTREQEQRLLQEAVSQVGNSPVDFIRAAERHLARFPQSVLRGDIERAVLRAAIDAKDNRRIIAYGERVVERDHDPMLLDRLARALLASDDPDAARRALPYAERLEKGLKKGEDAGRTLARALVLQARALGNLGELEKAVARAKRSFEAYPTAEAANEAGRWEAKLGRLAEAIEHYAEAFSVPDASVTAESRAHYRSALRDLYTRVHGSEAGLGDLILRAYDRTAQAVKVREEAARAARPNQDLQDAFEFRLSGLRGDSIRLADFRGKVLLVNFWATWCAPCRLEHPLLDELKARYKEDKEVAFVSIATDEDRSVVGPFVQELEWPDEVYFEDGLAQFYRLNSIPTTMIFNKRGEMVSRVAGFSGERYVERAVEKIEQARAE